MNKENIQESEDLFKSVIMKIIKEIEFIDDNSQLASYVVSLHPLIGKGDLKSEEIFK